jgi:hypothetical protein
LVALRARDLQSDEMTEIEVVLGDHSQQGLSWMRAMFPDAERAAEAEVLVNTWLATTSKMPPPPDMEGVLEKLLSSVKVKRLDKILEVAIHIPAAATLSEYRIALIGTAMSIAGEGMERYFLDAKIAEAKNTLAAIAQALSVYVSSNEKRLLPPSAPRVPAEVPKATEYQSVPADWSGSWQTLGFKLTDAQHYSYEIKTASNRRSAVIRATGDLDGDGTFSRFELDVKLVKSGRGQVLQIAPNLREVKPEE